MNRREAARNLMIGSLAMTIPVAAMAQGVAMRGGDPERRHAMDTLRIGGVALQSSQLAERWAMRARVRGSARFEVAEQTMVAGIIRDMTGMTPPPPDREAQAMMARLMAARGAAFDMAYVCMQLDGHLRAGRG